MTMRKPSEVLSAPTIIESDWQDAFKVFSTNNNNKLLVNIKYS